MAEGPLFHSTSLICEMITLFFKSVTKTATVPGARLPGLKSKTGHFLTVWPWGRLLNLSWCQSSHQSNRATHHKLPQGVCMKLPLANGFGTEHTVTAVDRTRVLQGGVGGGGVGGSERESSLTASQNQTADLAVAGNPTCYRVLS